MPKAYSYLRFSTPEQMRGDSFRRQTDAASHYARTQGLELDDRSYQDLGISAFRGANLETGRLGEFRAAVEAGAIEPGSFLLVESLDRLSRNKPRKAVRVLEDICESGIKVVTLGDGKLFDVDTLDDDPMAFMWAFMVAMRANEESATKSRRVREAWKAKRASAGSKVLTSRGPAWLRLESRRWVVIEDRAAIVRRIFDRALAGVGQERIAAELNAESIPCFGDSTRKAAEHWRRSYVVKVLESRAVVGTFIPHVTEHVDGRKRRRPLDPVEGYFPAVVERETFDAFQALRMGKTVNPQRGRHAAGVIRNALGGLARCPLCGGAMTRITKGSRTKAGKPYLVCQKAKVGAGCRYRTVPCEQVEAALMANVEWIEATGPAGGTYADLSARITFEEKAEQEALARRDRLVDAIANGSSEGLREALDATELELVSVRTGIKGLRERMEIAEGPLLRRKLVELATTLAAPLDPARVNVALRQVASHVVVDFKSGLLSIVWKHGGEATLRYAPPENPADVPDRWRKAAAFFDRTGQAARQLDYQPNYLRPPIVASK